MTESTTLTPHQVLLNRLKEGHPQKQICMLLDRIEKLEEGLSNHEKAHIIEPMVAVAEKKSTRSEKMKAVWAKKKAEKE